MFGSNGCRTCPRSRASSYSFTCVRVTHIPHKQPGQVQLPSAKCDERAGQRPQITTARSNLKLTRKNTQKSAALI